MIELLIVIAVLGILAVAVLSAINPIEQINRSRDTGGRSDAEQLIGAVDRFYANNGYYPWQIEPDELTDDIAWTAVGDLWTDGTTPVLDKLSGTGTNELKTSFTTRITDSDYNDLYVYNGGEDGESTYVCFNPASQQFATEAFNRCGSDELPADFPASACGLDAENSFSCLP